MTEKTDGELDVPDGVREAKSADEVLRAWIADGALHVTFPPAAFANDVSEWGRLLADIAHHIAKAVALDGQHGEPEALDAIKSAFERGIGSHGADRHGKIKGRTRH